MSTSLQYDRSAADVSVPSCRHCGGWRHWLGIRYACAFVLLILSVLSCHQGIQSSRVVRVFAASSLASVLTAAETAFETLHPAIDIRLSFAGSQVAKHQILAGAPADVFMSAHHEYIAALTSEALVVEKMTVAFSGLAIVTAANMPEPRSYTDLPSIDRIVLGASEVPLGMYTRESFAKVGPEFASKVLPNVVSLESNAQLVIAKVALGEAGAAIAYRHMGGLDSKVQVQRVPVQYDVDVKYVAAILKTNASQQESTEQFVDYLASQAGRQLFKEFGFDTSRREAQVNE
ncbi:MAG: molybdate ABC transporter substrate-binding protein [Myxococcota bacterium]|nr:molybdate ABC transporter substrate-binding protein [Myxococcota bacterium]